MELQQLAEEKAGALIVFTLLVVGVGLLIKAVPLFFTKAITEPVPGMKPYNALQVTGRDICACESCCNCHSQVIRPFRARTERYGHHPVAGKSVYDHPFQWDSKRTGPDLAHVGDRCSDEWHRIHLPNPRNIMPESNMPAFPWLAHNGVDAEATVAHMKVLHKVGTPYSDEEIAEASEVLANKSEPDAVIAYLQDLGLALRNVR